MGGPSLKNGILTQVLRVQSMLGTSRQSKTTGLHTCTQCLFNATYTFYAGFEWNVWCEKEIEQCVAYCMNKGIGGANHSLQF